MSITVTFLQPSPAQMPPHLGNTLQVQVAVPEPDKGTVKVNFQILDSNENALQQHLTGAPDGGPNTYSYGNVNTLGLAVGSVYYVVALATVVQGAVVQDSGGNVICATKV